MQKEANLGIFKRPRQTNYFL